MYAATTSLTPNHRGRVYRERLLALSNNSQAPIYALVVEAIALPGVGGRTQTRRTHWPLAHGSIAGSWLHLAILSFVGERLEKTVR